MSGVESCCTNVNLTVPAGLGQGHVFSMLGSLCSGVDSPASWWSQLYMWATTVPEFL